MLGEMAVSKQGNAAVCISLYRVEILLDILYFGVTLENGWHKDDDVGVEHWQCCVIFLHAPSHTAKQKHCDSK